MPAVASTHDLLRLTRDIITPLLAVERTMVMPFDHARHENVGEHSFSLALLAGALADAIDKTLDVGKVVQYATVHDVVEVHVGDVTVWESDAALLSKAKDETLAALRIAKDFATLPWVARTYQSYERLDTPEKCFVYALDKLYPHMLILIADHHPVHPSWEAYKRTEVIARQKIAAYPGLLPLFDELCSMFRQRPYFFSTPIPSEDRPRT
jgi:hypothetical protein